MLSLYQQINTMEKLEFEKDIIVFGIEVKNFPEGIDAAFEALIKQTGDCAGQRNYYGICMYKDDRMVYKAVTEEKYKGEGSKLGYGNDVIEKGAYLYQTLYHWSNKTKLIKDIFSGMMQDERIDTQKPSVEWYKSDEEMLCMLRLKNSVTNKS
jgi:hypothetical protein